MKTTSIDQRTARPPRAVISVTGQAGLKKQRPGMSRWLKPLAILCFMVNTGSADTFGLFTYTDNGTTITITGYPTSATGAVVIPAKIPPDTGKPVTSIGNNAFQNCSGLSSLTIPSSVTSIGNQAFEGCASLQSVTIPAGVTTIGGYAFRACTLLTSITIPSGLTSIDYYVFSGCTSLQSVTIPAGVTTIGGYAFEGSGLRNVTIPNSVTSIGDLAFSRTPLSNARFPTA